MNAAPAPVPALAGATLTPVRLEEEFRARTLAEDAPTAAVLVGGISLFLLAFVAGDLRFLSGAPALAWVLAARALHLGASAALVRAMLRATRPATLDRLALAWALTTVALDLVVNTTRPPEHHLTLMLGAVMVAGYWTLLPNRFALQGISASAAVVGQAVVLAGYRAPLPTTSLALVFAALASAFLGGAWVSWRLHRARRTAFLDLKGAEAARDALARALAEARTLRGLIPICAACKAMKAPDGSWHELEEVLSQRTEAEFTHGLCDRCVDKLYPVR